MAYYKSMILNSVFGNFLCKGSESKRIWVYIPYGLCCNYSTLSVQFKKCQHINESNHRIYVKKECCYVLIKVCWFWWKESVNWFWHKDHNLIYLLLTQYCFFMMMKKMTKGKGLGWIKWKSRVPRKHINEFGTLLFAMGRKCMHTKHSPCGKQSVSFFIYIIAFNLYSSAFCR